MANPSEPQGLGARPECFSSTAAEILFVTVATMSVAMTSLLAGGMTVVTNRIGEDLNMTNGEITWITASVTLAAGAFLLFFGRVSDLFGRKLIFVSSLFLFALFCMASGFAKTGITFDILQGVTGLWTAAAVPPAIGSLGAVYAVPSKRKNYAFACFSAGNPLGWVIGSIACGIATQVLGWRSYLWFLAIVYLTLSIVAFFVVPADNDPKEPLSWQTLRNFDTIGTILCVSGIGLLSASLTLAGDAPEGWRTPYVLITLILGFVLCTVFLLWESKAYDPLIPMWVWRDRDFSLLLLILFLSSGCFSAASFWITLYIQRFWTSSSLLVAVYIIPMAVAGILVNIITGAVLHRISNKLIMAIGSFAYVLSFLFMGLEKTSYGYWPLIFPSFCICVIGADTQFNVVNMYVMTALPRRQQSTGGGIFQTVNRLSQTVVFGITTAIFNALQPLMVTKGYHANDPIAPYAGVFYFCTAMCAVSLPICAFLRVGVQGAEIALGVEDDDEERGTEKGGERQREENGMQSEKIDEKVQSSDLDERGIMEEEKHGKDDGNVQVRRVSEGGPVERAAEGLILGAPPLGVDIVHEPRSSN